MRDIPLLPRLEEGREEDGLQGKSLCASVAPLEGAVDSRSMWRSVGLHGTKSPLYTPRKNAQGCSMSVHYEQTPPRGESTRTHVHEVDPRRYPAIMGIACIPDERR